MFRTGLNYGFLRTIKFTLGQVNSLHSNQLIRPLNINIRTLSSYLSELELEGEQLANSKETGSKRRGGRKEASRSSQNKHESRISEKEFIPEHVRAHPNTFGTMKFGHLSPEEVFPQEGHEEEEEKEIELEDWVREDGYIKKKLKSKKKHLNQLHVKDEEFEDNIFAQEEEGDTKFIADDRMTMRKLLNRTKELVKGQKLTEAIDLFVDSIKAGGFYYSPRDMDYLFNYMICECGKAGYPQMAFKLYDEKKMRGLFVAPHTYTSLFNACGNSAWNSEDNLDRIKWLRQKMEEKGHIPNLINYHAMIKAYGRCGDIQSAFAICDEMKREDLYPNIETFAFLLQASISDKENGFLSALITWKKIYLMRNLPSLYTYNLLLRAVRECGVKLPYLKDKPNQKMIRSNHDSSNNEQMNNLPAPFSTIARFGGDNLFQTIDKSLEIIHYEQNKDIEGTQSDQLALNFNKSLQRFALLGGKELILRQMDKERIQPDLKTMTELLQLVPIEEVNDMIEILKRYKIKADIDFFNLMIKRYSYDGKYDEAKNVLDLMTERDLYPNIMTWGVLAIGCRSLVIAQNLLKDMKAANFRPNIIILGSLMENASHSFNPIYVNYIMSILDKYEILPDPRFLISLEKFRMTVKAGLVSKELGKEVKPFYLSRAIEHEHFEYEWRMFLMNYERWKEQKKIHEEPKDPWIKHYKSKYPNARR